MNWSDISDGYDFKIYFSHGNHGSYVVESIKCELNDDKFEKIVNILEYIVSSTEKYFEGSTEDVAKYISTKTPYTEDQILEVIMPIVMSDIKWEENIASAVYVEVYRYKNGQVKHLRLENK